MASTAEGAGRDRGKAFVQVLACVLGRLVATNDAIADQGVVTKFHALRSPSISIRDYLERMNKYASCSPECFVLALVYIDRLIQRNALLLTSLNVHRVIVTSVMLAAKFFDDQYFNNAYFAKVGGVPTPELNSLELEFLFSVNFSLQVTTDVFEKYVSELANHMGIGVAPELMCNNTACDCARAAEWFSYSYEELRYTGMRTPQQLAAEAAEAAAAAATASSSSSFHSPAAAAPVAPTSTFASMEADDSIGSSSAIAGRLGSSSSTGGASAPPSSASSYNSPSTAAAAASLFSHHSSGASPHHSQQAAVAAAGPASDSSAAAAASVGAAGKLQLQHADDGDVAMADSSSSSSSLLAHTHPGAAAAGAAHVLQQTQLRPPITVEALGR